MLIEISRGEPYELHNTATVMIALEILSTRLTARPGHPAAGLGGQREAKERANASTLEGHNT